MRPLPTMRLPTWFAIGAAAAAAAAIKVTLACSPCPPGERRFLPCSSDERRICVPCPQNTFSSKYSLSDECEYCRNYCIRVNEIIIANCTSRSDIICQCKPGTWLRKEQEPFCLPHTKCPRGSGVKHIGTESSDTVCEKCPPGYYSDSVSATDRCQQWTDCQDTGVKVPGGELSDNVCHPAAATVHKEALQDWAVAAIVVGAVVAVIIALSVAFIVLRRRAALRRPVYTSGKNCILAQPSDMRRPPPAYGEVLLNDLDSMPSNATVLPLLALGSNIESDDVNRNIIEDFEKLEYKICQLPRDFGNSGSRSSTDSSCIDAEHTHRAPSQQGTRKSAARPESLINLETVTPQLGPATMQAARPLDAGIREVFALLSRIMQPYYIPFFQRLPNGLSPEQISTLEMTLVDGDQQSVVLECLQTWYGGLPAADLAMEYLVETLRHEAIGDRSAAAQAQLAYEEATRHRPGGSVGSSDGVVS